MKTQLLQDLDESNSSASVPTKTRPAQPTVSAPPTVPAAPTVAAPPAPLAAQPAPKVWTGRPAAAEPVAADTSPSPSPSPSYQFDAPPAVRVDPALVEPPHPIPVSAGPIFRDQHLGHHQAQDLAQDLAPAAPIELKSARKGTKAGSVGFTLAALAVVGVVGAWMYNETRIDDTLSLLAHHSKPVAAPVAAPAPKPAVAEDAASAAVAAADAALQASAPPVVAAPAEATPPLVMLAKQDAPAAPVAAESVEETPEPVAQVEEAPPAKAETKAQARAAARRDARRAAQAEAKLAARDEDKADEPKSSAKRMTAAAAPKAAKLDPAAETLRLCREAGYHETQCVERSCKATRYGLVCRG